MVLPDRRLVDIVATHWKQANLDNINAASVDLELDSKAIIYDWPLHYRLMWYMTKDDRWLRRKRLVDLRKGPFLLRPGQMALLATKEWIVVPPKYAAIITLKSSRGREGYDHALAGWFDPGFQGNGVFEVYANATPVWLSPDLRFAQIIFFAMLQEPQAPYDGHYQGQKGVTESWTIS